jgi:hypothetical protein
MVARGGQLAGEWSNFDQHVGQIPLVYMLVT